MCNQMEMSDIIPVLSINIMGDEWHSQSWIFWHVYSGFIVIWELHALKSLELKFGLTSEFSDFFDKIPVRILLDVLFHGFRFSKASLDALTSSFTKF